MGMFMSVPYVQVSGVHQSQLTTGGYHHTYNVACEITIIDHRLKRFL